MLESFSRYKTINLNRTNATNRYLELDALRGMAALMVVLFHFTMGRPEADYGFKLGTTGVDLFFIISGFVILMSIEHVKSSYQFVVNRFCRLYPTYWVAVIFGFIILNLHYVKFNTIVPLEWDKFFVNLSMFQFYLNKDDIDGPYWTMIIEMLFYIFMLIVSATKSISYLTQIGALLVLFSLSLVHNWFNIPWSNELLSDIPLLQFVPLFFAGILFYKIKTSSSVPIIYHFLILGCLFAQISMFNSVGRSKSFIEHWQYGVVLSLYFLLFYLFVLNKLSFIVSKPTLFLGKVSFALYLTHQRISLTFLIPWFTEKCGLNFFVAAFLITLPICISLAALITFYIEIPTGKWIKSKLISTN